MEHAPALALVEVGSLARAYTVLDAAVKKAPITVLRFDEVSPGKTLLLFAGGESEVDEALHEARVVSGDALLDHLLLPGAHPALIRMLRGGSTAAALDSVGVLETRTAAAAIRAADAGLKAAQVSLIKLRLALNIGGKGLVVFTGALGDADAALDAGAEAAGADAVLGRERIAQPHPEILGRFSL
jgi:microcompartment protein CcmL/EutN